MLRRIDEIAVFPAEQLGEHLAQVARAQPYRRVLGFGFIEQTAEFLSSSSDVAVRHDLRVDHHRRRDHDSDGLNEAQATPGGRR